MVIGHRPSTMMLEIGRATKGKGAEPLHFANVKGHQKGRMIRAKASMEPLLQYADPFNSPFHFPPFSKLIETEQTFPTTILQVSRTIKYANRTLVSAYAELGHSLGLYNTDSAGRAILLTTTPVFDIWEKLQENRYEDIAKVAHYLAKYQAQFPLEVKQLLSELKQAFFVAQTLESDPLAKRRYEILASLTVEALASENNVSKTMEDMAGKLMLMHEMAGIPSSELLEGFTVKEKGEDVSIEWTRSGSKEPPARK